MANEILMPALSPTMEEGTLAKWLVGEGDNVQPGDLIAEIETDKATMEFEAVDEGVIGKLLVPAGTANVAVNSPIALLLEDDETSVPTEAPAPAVPQQKHAAPTQTAPRIFASPLARRIAQAKGIDLKTITGSGPRGRIIKADLNEPTATEASSIAAVPVQATTAPLAPPTQIMAPTSSDVLKAYADRTFTEVPLDGMRKTIAQRLTEAKQTIPHFYLRRSVNLDALLSFRSQLNQQLQQRDIKISINDFIIKACALALQSVPAANAIWANDRIFQMTASDIAVAVSIEGGLFTPVIQDTESKNLSDLSAEMKDLANRAKQRKLAPHEYQGGSFAISNLGMFGIENFDAVINPPHGAILAVGAGVKKPIVTDDGSIASATLMSLTMSVDHRVIDGALAAQLLNAIVENLENPMVMLV